MDQSEMDALVQLLAANPDAGDLIVGSGGCRKVRLARKDGGKSGGYRVVTFFTTKATPVYVVAVLAKASRANFTAEEVKAMKTLAGRILAARPARETG